MYMLVLLLVSASAWICHGVSVPDEMSLEAQEYLVGQYGESILENIIQATPIYRKDLANDYEAYWEVVLNDGSEDLYLVISSGDATGDDDEVERGKLPSPTASLIEKAEKLEQTCVKFYLRASEGLMTCEDKKGRTVAVSLPDSEVLNAINKTEPLTVKKLQLFISAHEADEKEAWTKHTAAVMEKKNNIGMNSNTTINVRGIEMSEADFHALALDKIHSQSKKRDLGIEEEAFEVFAITAGIPEIMVVGNINISEIQVKLIKDMEAVEQEEFTSMVNITRSGRTIKIVLSEEAASTFGENLIFSVSVIGTNGDIVLKKYYGLVGPSDELDESVEDNEDDRKRGYQYKSWTDWSYTGGVSYESLVPDYNQFTYGSCAVGCGPVAWATVFGFYDRRDHLTSWWGSQALYRSGPDGTTGANYRVAPINMGGTESTRIRNYIKKMHDIVDTFCLLGGGTTWFWDMNDVDGFFKARQSQSSAKVIRKYNALKTPFAIYDSDIEYWTRDRLKQGWPVIIGWRAGGDYLKWHYPIATQYRVRQRERRWCVLFVCGSWKTETHRMVYLHMGWGGSGDKWVNLNAWYAVAAVW